MKRGSNSEWRCVREGIENRQKNLKRLKTKLINNKYMWKT